MANETECGADRTCIVGEDTLLLEVVKERKRRNPGPAISPLLLASCIFKVPEVLRRHNPKAYEPDVVSIGPLHPRDDEKFQRMETVKQWYLDTLLTRMEISFEKFVELINNNEPKGIIEFEKRAREFYAEPLDHLTPSKFIYIMILDGCFVIQLLWKKINGEIDYDPILNMDCMFQYVCHDLLLLENQLPWFVLSCLYRLTFEDRGTQFSVVLLNAFGSQNSLHTYLGSYLDKLRKPEDRASLKQKLGKFEDGALHILDLIRTFIVSEFRPFKPSSRNDKECLCCFGEKEEKKYGSEIPSATALSKAGVKFKRSLDNNLMNIEFKNGDLTIPELAIGELTEPLFRNLIAFEQCYHGRSHKITSYAVFMDKLISSNEDIKLLSDEKILGNWLNEEDGSNFFNSLYIDTTVIKFQYDELCTDLNKYYHVEWNKHFEQFRRDYCSTPWKRIALVVGGVILFVQLLQLFCSILSTF